MYEIPFDYDLHTHTNLSDGKSPVSLMVVAAVGNGVKTLAITDHAFDDSQAEKLLDEYSRIDRSRFPVRIVWGCEAAVKDETGTPTVRDDLLRRFELVLMDCNYILFSKIAKAGISQEATRDLLCDILVKASANPFVRIMAHPFNFGIAPISLPLSLFDDSRVAAVAKAFKANGKVFEIMNMMYFWHSATAFDEFEREYLRILRIFQANGVQFSVGSDAHCDCGVGCLPWSRKIVDILGEKDRLFCP